MNESLAFARDHPSAIGKHAFPWAALFAAMLSLSLILLVGCKRSETSKPGASAKSAMPRPAMITAKPNPVSAGRGEGKTVVSWDTGDGSEGEVYLSVSGNEERLFAKGVKASKEATWISAGPTYEFRLYQAPGRAKVLTTVEVTRRKKP